MNKYLFSVLVFVFGLMLVANTTFAATIFSEDFGVGSSVNNIPGWDETGQDNSSQTNAESPSNNGEDTVSPNGGRFAKIYEDQWICREINVSGYQNLMLSYYWRGDDDAENDDQGIVEYIAGTGSCDINNNNFTNLKIHNLDIDNSWSNQSSFALPESLNNTTFRLRFRNVSSNNDEYFRVDGVLITGDVIPAPQTTAKVTIVKYINGVPATSENTNNASFSMTSSWDAINTGPGGGNYTLNSAGYNNPNPYQATTSDMTVGAEYTTYENTETTCVSPMMYALVGYTSGDTLEEASLAEPSLTPPNFTDLQSDKFVIVWNKTCVDLPTHLSPADNSIKTTAEQTLIDWSDVFSWASPVTYIYQSALSMITDIDGSFVDPAYTSGALTDSEIPTPNTP